MIKGTEILYILNLVWFYDFHLMISYKLLLKTFIIIGKRQVFSNIYSESAFVLVFSYYLKSNVKENKISLSERMSRHVSDNEIN